MPQDVRQYAQELEYILMNKIEHIARLCDPHEEYLKYVSNPQPHFAYPNRIIIEGRRAKEELTAIVMDHNHPLIVYYARTELWRSENGPGTYEMTYSHNLKVGVSMQ